MNKRSPAIGELFTPEELVEIANASLDYYLTPDNLTPRERSRERLREARQALREAEAQLKAALVYKAAVRRMSFVERNKRWERKKAEDPLARD